MTVNKISLKHNYIFWTTAPIMTTALLGTMGVITHDSTINPENKEAVIGMTLSSVALIIMWAYLIIDENKRFSSRVARKYLKQAMIEYPELKDFKSVLSNPKAVKSLATFISNSLRPSEQQIILDLLETWDGTEYTNRFAQKKGLSNLQNQITKIIKEHCDQHREFIGDLYAMMANAEHTYVMPIMNTYTR